MVAIAIEEESRMRRYIEATGYFSVNLLPSGATEAAKHYLKGPEASNGAIAGRGYRRAAAGTPFLDDANACLECRVRSTLPCGDHILVVGEIVDALIRKAEESVLTLRETGWRYSR
jgi:flavin reductase (DIM6/NTAB) family NADH-FMN oxidoreductase RutF